MAEPTPAPKPANPVTPKQYIRASANDDALEPDALRGNEQIIKDLGIQDDDAERRKKISGA